MKTKTRKLHNRVPKDAQQFTTLEYRAQGPTLRRFHRSDAPVQSIIGPLGSGKTQAVINKCIILSHNQPPMADGVRRSRGCVARNTFPDLNSSTIPDWRALADRIPGSSFSMGSPPTWTARYPRKDGTHVEVEVLFRSFDGPQDQRKARGMQLTWLWCNEAAEMNKSNVDLLMSRVGRYPPPKQAPEAVNAIFMDSNAPDRDHWMAKLALDSTPDTWAFFIQPPAVLRRGGDWITNKAAENLQNLKPGYYTNQLGGKAESWIRKNLANEFVFHSDGRPVHPGFNEQFHVAPGSLTPTPGLPLHVGVDFGRTPAAAVMQRQVNGQWYVLDELCTYNTNALDFGHALRRLLNDRYSGFEIECTGDPAGNDMAQTRDETPMDMLAAAGVECYPAPTNDFEERTTALDELLARIVDGQPAFLISHQCRTLVKGLAGAYQFRRIQVVGDERYHDKPVKDDTSHVCEAVHYGLLGAGEGETLFSDAWTASMDGDDWYPDTRYFE